MNPVRSIYRLLAITLSLSLTLGCNFPSGLGAAETATPVPKPVNMMVSVDDTHATSAAISEQGGTISTQGSDGTKFTLTFPEGALLSNENITLTPVSSVEGLPFSGGLVGGVQMAPEGLRLFQPATLTIESPKTVATEGFETVAFGYHQNGEGVYLNPSTITGNTLKLEVWHFSGQGAAQATPAEIQTHQQRVPSNAEDTLTQRMQEYFGRERQAQLLGEDPDPEFWRIMGEFLREAYDSLIAPQLPIALQDCEAARPILSKALGWSRQVQLLGYTTEFQSEIALIMETMNQAIVNCYNKEYDQCVIDNKIQHRTAMIGFFREASVLGIAGQLDQSKIEKCPKMGYQVTTISSFTEQGVTLVATMNGKMEMGADGRYAGSGTVNWVGGFFTALDCGSQFDVAPSKALMTGVKKDDQLIVEVTYLAAELTNIGGCPGGVNNQAQVLPDPVTVSVPASGGEESEIPQNLHEPTFYSFHGSVIITVTAVTQP